MEILEKFIKKREKLSLISDNKSFCSYKIRFLFYIKINKKKIRNGNLFGVFHRSIHITCVTFKVH